MRLDADSLEERAARARAMLSPCVLCPRQCRSARLRGERGSCGIGAEARVASYGPHFGEEPPLVGTFGSGTIFFSGCNLRCVYCQNHEIRHPEAGVPVSPGGLAAMALDLESQGCHNLNLVSPTHAMPQILAGLAEARRQGFDLPIVWNCGGYEAVDSLRLLDGVVDIYMPDFKYGDEKEGRRLSGVDGYPEIARFALVEMHRQVGDLALDERGVAMRGLLVRHLVLPEGRAGTGEVSRFLAREISIDTWVNVMDPYHPSGVDCASFGLDRRCSSAELSEAASAARQAGLHRGIFPAP